MAGLEWLVLEDNTDKVIAALNTAYLKGLNGVGLAAEGFAKQNLYPNHGFRTGHLKRSITHKVEGGELAAYIGTDVHYGKYVEFGTGAKATGGYGDPTIGGMKAIPFLRPAASNHRKDYNEIIKNALANENY